MPKARRWWRLLALLATVLATTICFAPSVWLGDYLAQHSAIRLIDCRGSLWNGSAMLGVSNGRRTLLAPGRVSWQVAFLPLWAGRLVMQMQLPTFAAGLELQISGDGLRLKEGTATAPASVLATLGAPFNTVQPGGVLRLRWGEIRAASGKLEGQLDIDWVDAQSALSRVAPLGDFRLEIKGQGEQAKLTLGTLKGPLKLEGEGVLSESGIKFSGTASTEESMRSALNTLIGILGPRDGDKVLLRLNG